VPAPLDRGRGPRGTAASASLPRPRARTGGARPRSSRSRRCSRKRTAGRRGRPNRMSRRAYPATAAARTPPPAEGSRSIRRPQLARAAPAGVRASGGPQRAARGRCAGPPRRRRGRCRGSCSNWAGLGATSSRRAVGALGGQWDDLARGDSCHVRNPGGRLVLRVFDLVDGAREWADGDRPCAFTASRQVTRRSMRATGMTET